MRDEVMKKIEVHCKEAFQATRFYTHIGKTSKEQLELHLKTIDEFIEKVKDSDSNEKLDLTVPSYALKRDLGKKVNAKYMGQNIFSEFKKGTDTFTVKKWKNRNNPTGQ